MARLTLADLEQEQLETFKRFWDGCGQDTKRRIKLRVKHWRSCVSAMWAIPDEINAMRNAGALVHVHGIDADGDWAVEVKWRGDFNRGVFAVMGEPDPDHSVEQGNE